MPYAVKANFTKFVPIFLWGWLKKIHELTTEKILDKANQGEYRRSRVVIKNSQSGEVSFRPPLPLEIKMQIEEFFDWLNSDVGRDVHPILRAGITHYELARIHPFVDGNGRVARSFALLVLYRENYDIKRFFSIEEYFDKNAEEYYTALQSVNKKSGDLTLWLEVFTKALAVELNKIKERVRRISLDSRVKDKLGEQVELNERQMIIMEYLHRHKAMQNRDFRKIFPDYSDDTVLREIKFLKQKDLVKKTGGTKNAIYVLK